MIHDSRFCQVLVRSPIVIFDVLGDDIFEYPVITIGRIGLRAVIESAIPPSSPGKVLK